MLPWEHVSVLPYSMLPVIFSKFKGDISPIFSILLVSSGKL
ncbi:unnamed protein product, partial [marine sediment metagenome]